MKTCTALVAALIMFGLLLPEANAAHPTQLCLDVEPDTYYGVGNDDKVDHLTAWVGVTDAGHPPEQEGCVISEEPSFEGTGVDFEITGEMDPDASDTPETPDLTCTVTADEASCNVEPPSASGGTQTITGWIDFDDDNTTPELDRDETQGDKDTDATDVTTWSWTHYDYFLWISIRYQRDRERFVGTVSTQPGCTKHRKVTAKKKVGDRRVRVGSDVTDRRGKWRIPLKDAKGRYFAVASSKFSDADASRCRRLRSGTIRVR